MRCTQSTLNKPSTNHPTLTIHVHPSTHHPHPPTHPPIHRNHYQEDCDEYTDEFKLRDMLKRYSSFITFPIELWAEKTEYVEVRFWLIGGEMGFHKARSLT